MNFDIFSTNIEAFILQSGFFSRPLNIKRGCRQDLVALKRAGRSKTHPDWMATEEAAAAVEAVLKW